jgi:hypothetical protein
MGALTAPPLIALCCRISFKTSLTHWIVVDHILEILAFLFIYFLIRLKAWLKW